MLKILQVRLQQYMNHEIPDVQARFKKGRGTRYRIANIHWIWKLNDAITLLISGPILESLDDIIYS